MLLTIRSHKLGILLCCSPKSVLQPAGAWVYYGFKCEWDTICFLHLRLNSIFVPSLCCQQRAMCSFVPGFCLRESPFRNPCQTSEGITVMFHPIRFTSLPKYLPLWGSSSSHNTAVVGQPSELHLRVTLLAQPQQQRWMSRWEDWEAWKRRRRWRMRENVTRIRSVLMMHLNTGE